MTCTHPPDGYCPICYRNEELTALRARVAELEAALEPFAMAGRAYPAEIPDTYEFVEELYEPPAAALLTVADLRRAAAVLDRGEGEGEG